MGTVIVFRDITQRELLRREKQRALKLESIGLLAGGIAHDFNNVLTVIAGNVSAALLDDTQPKEVRRGLEEAAEGGELAAGSFLLVSFQDEGPGIDPADHGRVFDPYFTTKPNGSGLGLATVFSIVKRHHGRVWIDSTPGAGTTFNLWLPAKRKAEENGESNLPTMNEQLQGRVLFMDDEPGICRMAANVLRRLGLEIVVANDGEQAIKTCRAAHADGRAFNLLILDLTVPGVKGGREVLEDVRSFASDVKAIVSSGYSSDAALANYSDHGFVGRLAKPYQLVELINVVRQALRNKPPAQPVREPSR